MDTIMTYLDNIFAALPKSEAVLRARKELQANMEEKYQALKAEGKSENESVGTVISEFGNIDELISELGIKPTGSPADDQPLPLLDRETVAKYLDANAQAARLIGTGVFLCIMAVAMMILTNLLVADGFLAPALRGSGGSALGLFPLFFLIAIGVGLFIFSGIRMERYAWIEKGFQLQSGLKSELEGRQERFMPTFTVAIIVGVGLCILSPIPLFAAAVFPQFMPQYGLVVLLSMVAVAVFVFVRFGMIKDGYAKLLQQGDYEPKNRKNEKAEKVTGVVAAVVFPLAAAIYLLLGFVGSMWHPGWLIFPITGILFGIFSAIYEAVSSGK